MLQSAFRSVFQPARLTAFAGMILLLAGCGTNAVLPAPLPPTLVLPTEVGLLPIGNVGSVQVAFAPTLPPTSAPTLIRPSATPTLTLIAPTATSVPATATLPPTAAPSATTAPTAASGAQPAGGSNAQVAAAPAGITGDATRGEVLFKQGNGVAPQCSACHSVADDSAIVNLGKRDRKSGGKPRPRRGRRDVYPHVH